MRDRGGDVVPPDVRFAGKCPVCDESSALEEIEMRNCTEEGDADEKIA
jgi:hypothetical protein